jgi:hypothetical protein
MMIVMRDNIAKFLVLLLIFIFAPCCSKTVENGKFKFLEIGNSKDEVIKKTTAAGITDLLPSLESIISIKKGEMDKFELISKSPGIEITDNKGFSIQLSFKEDAIYDINYSVPARKVEGQYFKNGMSRDEALGAIKKIVSLNPHIEIFNFLPNSRWISLNSIDEDDMKYLHKYDVWTFHGVGEYSNYKLVFKNDVLAKIIYEWSPFELP